MRFIILFSIIGILISCDNPTKTEKETTPILSAEQKTENKRVEEVMHVHDEVMPKMANISRIRRELKNFLKNNPDLETTKTDEVNTTIQHLDQADEGMMTWMANWTNTQGELQKYKNAKNHQAVMNFLEEQMKGITKVRDDMLNSIQQGETLTKNLIKK